MSSGTAPCRFSSSALADRAHVICNRSETDPTVLSARGRANRPPRADRSHHLPWLLRFTDFELLRCATIPVLLVKTREPYARPKILAAIDPGHTFAKPLSLDAEILRCGAAVAQALRGALHVVHAFESLPAAALTGDYLTGDWVMELEEVTEKQALAALGKTVGTVAIPRANQHLIARHPIDAIEETAASIGSDIVVMGAVSRSGLPSKNGRYAEETYGRQDFTTFSFILVGPQIGIR